MKKIVLFAALLCGFWAQAQTTVTNSIFPVGGDTLLRSSTTNIGAATITAASATAQSWDFSFLTTDVVLFDTVRYASLGTAYNNFPTSEIIVPVLGFGQGYVDVTSTNMTMIGAGLELLGLSFVAPFTNTLTLQTAPFTSNSSINDTHALQFAAHIDSVPGLRMIIDQAGLPISPDSIRLNLTGSTSLEVDAFGTCTLYDSTYNVLRQKVRILNETKIEVYVPAFGTGFWLDVTSTLGAQLPFPLNDTTNRYDFWKDGSKIPVALFIMDAGNTNITSIEFKGYNLGSAVLNTTELKDITVFPNPANEMISLRAEGLGVTSFNLQIMDAMGRVLQKSQNLTEGVQNIAVSNLPQGTFWVVLLAEDGRLLARKTISIQR